MQTRVGAQHILEALSFFGCQYSAIARLPLFMGRAAYGDFLQLQFSTGADWSAIMAAMAGRAGATATALSMRRVACLLFVYLFVHFCLFILRVPMTLFQMS